MQAQPNMGMSQYPPTFSYSMAGAQNPNERMANRLMGGGLGAAQGVVGAAGMVNMVAGVGSMIGLGGAGLAAAGSLPVALGLGAGAVGIGAMAAGHRQMAQTNQIFGNQMFANNMNPAGRGFSRGDLNTLYGAVRAIDKNDPFVSMGDALRVTQSAVSDFGMAQGVENAEKLAKKVTDMGKALAKMAKTMGTTIDEAKQIFGMSRQAGFYTASDVMGNTQNFMINRGLGFTSEQTGAIQAGAAAAARGAGLAGGAGARFATGMTQNLALQMQMGTIDEFALMDATGTMTRNDAAAAFAQTTQGVFTNMGQSAYGSAILGSLMTRDGQGGVGINQGLLESMRSGNVTLSDLRGRAGQNLGTQQGKLDFVNNRDMLMNELMGSEDAMSALVNTIEAEAERSGKDVQVLVQQITGLNNRDYRLVKEAAENYKKARQERLARAMAELNAQQHQQNIRENATIGGITQGIKGSIDDFFQDNFVDPGANIVGNIGQGMERAKLGAMEFFGHGQRSMKIQSSRFDELAQAALLSNIGASTTSLNQNAVTLATGGSVTVGGQTFSGAGSVSREDSLNFLAVSNNRTALSKQLKKENNVRAMSRLTPEDKEAIREKMKELHRTDDPAEHARILNEARRIVADRTGQYDTSRREGFGFALDQDALGSIDSAIAEVAGDVAGIQKGRAGDPNFEKGDTFNRVKAAQEALHASVNLSSTYGGAGDAAVGMTAGGAIGMVAGGIIGGAIGLLGGGVSAVPGAILGAKVGLAAGTAVGGLIGVAAGGKNYQEMFESGTGVGLLAKAKTGKGMKAIDSIITQVMKDPDLTNEEKKIKMAERLSAELGIEVTAEDVEVYEAAMAQKTGTKDAMDRSDRTVTEYERDYADAIEMANNADLVELGLATELGVKQLQTISQRLAGDLSELGLEDANITSSGKTLSGILDGDLTESTIEEYQGGLAGVIQAMSTQKISAEDVKDMGPMAQFLQQQSMRLTEVEGKFGDSMSLGDLATEFGLDPEDPFFKAAERMADEEGNLTREDYTKLVAEGLANKSLALGLEGAGALATAAQSGKSPMQVQAEAVQKSAEMIDAIYSRMSKTPPAFPESAAAAGAGYDTATGEWNEIE